MDRFFNCIFVILLFFLCVFFVLVFVTPLDVKADSIVITGKSSEVNTGNSIYNVSPTLNGSGFFKYFFEIKDGTPLNGYVSTFVFNFDTSTTVTLKNQYLNFVVMGYGTSIPLIRSLKINNNNYSCSINVNSYTSSYEFNSSDPDYPYKTRLYDYTSTVSCYIPNLSFNTGSLVLHNISYATDWPANTYNTYGNILIGMYPIISENPYSPNYSSIEDAIKDQTEQQHKDSEAVKDAIEGDNLDTGSIESSSNDALDDYKNAEGSLNLDGADLSSIELGLKPTVAARVWSTIQNLLDTNGKLMQYVISMLSIGLIKLFLGR